MMIVIIAATTFVAVACLAAVVAPLLIGQKGSVAESRLGVLTGAKSASAAGGGSVQSLLMTGLDKAPGAIEQFVSRFLNLQKLVDQSGLPITVSKLIVVSGLVMGGGTVAWGLLGPQKALAPVIGVSLGLLPLGYVWFARKQRMAKFIKQLPDALELVGRSLRAGHSLAAGLKMVAEEMAAPIGPEFQRAFEEQNLGVPLEEALLGLSERVESLDVRFFVTAVILQRQTGGDLAEILDKISHLIRERFKIWGQIQALTGEGRLSGIVLLALPPVLALVMYRLNPDYLMVLFTDAMGNKLLAVAVIMQLLGAAVIRKIVTIKV